VSGFCWALVVGTLEKNSETTSVAKMMENRDDIEDDIEKSLLF
jgi:hypothetical protein